MANDTPVTIVGNLTAAPELRFTQSGIAVANFTIASTPRVFDKQANEWKDGEALFMRSTIWRDAAENVAESLEKGSNVIASGRLVQRAFTDREGNNRTSVELEVDEIGPSLRYATARPAKVDRRAGGGQGGGFASGQGGYAQAPQNGPQSGGQGGYGAPQGRAQQGGAPQGGDPWAGGDRGGYDSPPF